MENKLNIDKISVIRRRVKAAFVELQKIGFITKTNFSCCQTCAIAELGVIAEKRRRNKTVYYHWQDKEHFRKTGILTVRFCYLPPKEISGDTFNMEKKIADEVANALWKQGLDFDWSGNPCSYIQVKGLIVHSTEEKENLNAGAA